MNKSMKIIFVVIGLVVAIVVVRLLMPSSSVPVSVVNNSAETIKEFKISLCDKTETLHDISAGQSKNISLKITGDCSYSAHVTFASGAVLEKDQLGFVAPDASYKDRFLVDSRFITFDRQISKN